VKEAVFAALAPQRIEGRTVLDLFAGSGALAIEALSRGASRAVLVDTDAAAVHAIETNLEHTHFGDRARARRGAVDAFLAQLPPPDAPFGLVTLDPPYETTDGEIRSLLEKLTQGSWLTESATVVVERPAGSSVSLPDKLALAWERTYGDTLVTIATVRSDS
jgi:16S rRNA (guanine966-N2)-methyltransferase